MGETDEDYRHRSKQEYPYARLYEQFSCQPKTHIGSDPGDPTEEMRGKCNLLAVTWVWIAIS